MFVRSCGYDSCLSRQDPPNLPVWPEEEQVPSLYVHLHILLMHLVQMRRPSTESMLWYIYTNLVATVTKSKTESQFIPPAHTGFLYRGRKNVCIRDSFSHSVWTNRYSLLAELQDEPSRERGSLDPRPACEKAAAEWTGCVSNYAWFTRPIYRWRMVGRRQSSANQDQLSLGRHRKDSMGTV